MNMDEATFNSIFAKNLRRYLDLNQMTQVELSKKLNVGTTSVYNWCSGIKIPRMDKVDKMCEIFGCNRSDLITDTSVHDLPEEVVELSKQIMTLPPAKVQHLQEYLKFLLSDS